MSSNDGNKLVDFVNNCFSNSIVSALGKQGKVKRKANHRKHIVKNQKVDRKLPKATKQNGIPKSQAQRLQCYQRESSLPADGLPLWPCIDNGGYTIMPAVSSENFIPSVMSSYEQQQQAYFPMSMTQSTLDLENLLRETPVLMPPSFQFTTGAPYETTVDYPTECYSDHSRPLTPYNNNTELSSDISDKELEDLLIDQLQSSPGSMYSSSSPMASCVPSPAIRACESQLMPTTYAVYEHMLHH